MCISIWILSWLRRCLIQWFLPLYAFSALTSFINEMAHSVLGSCKSLKKLILTLLSTAQSLMKLVLWQCKGMCVFTASLFVYKSMPQMWFHRKSVGSPRFYWMSARAKTLKLYITTTHRGMLWASEKRLEVMGNGRGHCSQKDSVHML